MRFVSRGKRQQGGIIYERFPTDGCSSLTENGVFWTLFEPAKNRNMTNCFISFVCSELLHLFMFYFEGFSDAQPHFSVVLVMRLALLLECQHLPVFEALNL